MMKRIAGVTIVAILALSICFALWTQPVAADEITPMQVSEKMVKLIEQMEGFDAVPFWDYSQWTVGFGSRCPDEDLERYRENGITPEEADQLMRGELAKFVTDVNSFMVRNQIQLEQNQFDALVSFVYNVGSSVLKNNSNTVIQAILNGAEGNDFMFAMGQWCSAGGDFLYGLLRRRMMESNIYLYGTYTTELPESYCYVKFDANGGARDCRAQAYDSNMPTAPLSMPTRSGYTFVGWFTEATGGTRVTALDETTNGMTLYAHWELGKVSPNQPTDPESGVEVQVTGENVYVRQAPGISSGIVTTVYKGEILLITGLTQKGGSLWGCFDKGWIALEHTNYFEVTGSGGDNVDKGESVEVPIYATVLSTSGVKVYKGPHTTYPEAGTLKEGELILIEESVYFCKQLWGRYEGGWVQLNQRILLHDDQVLAHRFTATVTYYYLNVRSGPGTNYSSLTTLKTGDKMEIFSVVIVDGAPWGRFISGWVYLDIYTDFDISKLEYYRNHSYGDWYEAKAPSCTEYGQLRRDCQHCDHYEVQKIEMVDHVLGDWYESKAGTCVELAEERRDCENCDYYETQETVLGDHEMGDWYISREATCIEVGQESRDCVYCDHVQTQDTTLGDHKWLDWVEILAPGCETAGQEQRDCEICEEFETREVEALGHSYGQWTETLAPGCETIGEEQRDCENCEHFETREVEALGHSYGEWTETLAPGCETAGEEQRNCENCEHFETRAVEALGHSYGEWTETLTPGCETIGEEQRNCENCEHFETRAVEALGHSYGEWTETLTPGCEAIGEEQRDCENCEHFETRAVEALGHDFCEWYETVTPTAEEEGEARRDCQRCEHYETKVLEKNPHIYGDWYVHTEPSCTAAGEERRDCQHCELFESRPVEMIDHSMGDWYTHQAPTCVAVGEERRDCENCDHYESREAAVVEHSYGDWYIHQEATCVAVGEERRDCQNCDHYESREAAMVEHSYGDWYTHQEATCVAAGEERRDCQTCDHYESREIASLGHSYGDWYIHQEATCVVVGEERRDCRNCDHYESRETGFGEHRFGDWYVSSEASCTAAGEERRDCDRCDHYEHRDTALLNHSYGNWYVVLEPTIDEEGMECRDCVYCDADQKRPVPVLPSVERTYAVITYSFLNIRAGASSSAAKMGVLYEGIKVEILEQVKVGSNTWGRIEYGWICLTGYTNMITVREELVADRGDKTFATITCDYLSVRPEPNSSTARLATIQNGARVRIYELRIIGSVTWGRTAFGWIWLTGYTALDVEKGEHLEHTYGDWYVFRQGTCVSVAQERRDCQECEHYETREGQLGGHSMDAWYVIAASTCVMPGMERQDCLFCDHYAERQIAPSGQHSMGQWYTATAPTCQNPGQSCSDCQHCDYFEAQVIPALEHTMGQWYVVDIPECEKEGRQFRDCANCHYSESKPIPALGHQFDVWYVAVDPGCENPGQERRDCLGCSHYETKDIPALGHRFGDWYVTKEATAVEMGQERRDCASCDHYETRNIERLPSAAGKMYGMFTGAGYLNIRNGAGMSYKAVGRLYPNNRVEIYEMVDVDGKTWGRIEGGWVCITGYIAVECEFVKLYATVTYSYLTIRAGAGSGTAKLGTLNQGDVVEILEIVAVGSKNWGRTAQGWICLTDHTTLATVSQVAQDGVSIRVCATITYSFLTIREGNSTNTAKVGTLKQGEVVEILEIVCVDGKEWGRTEQGWICLTGYTVLNTMN